MFASLRRGIRTLGSRRIYLFGLVIVPLVCAFFFLNLMHEGLPTRIPVGVVDMDRTAMSRELTRKLGAIELLDISASPESYHDAYQKVLKGELYGFFYIPRRFEAKAVGGETPTLSFYSNMTIFVPGTLSYKGFKTIAVKTSSGMVQTELLDVGLSDNSVSALTMPVNFPTHPIGNPWLNYSYYLSSSFIIGVVALMAMIMTCFSLGEEIKNHTAPEWLATARGSMLRAMLGKLLPQTFVMTAVGVAIQSLLYGWLHFPMNGPAWHMILAMFLLVAASQAFAAFVFEIVPNLRLSLSVVSLLGILAFSLAGFSFPVEQMYGSLGIFSYILPIRYYFLIYIDQALNGQPLYYSRLYYMALLGFLLLPFLLPGRLRRRALHPVYVP
ncbi:MAG: ABC transporter permease [Duncaniella sp.]|nr:ABC transporter permease [Duncaniella sp.]